MAGRGRARRPAARDRRAARRPNRTLTADPATREKLTTISLEPLPASTPDSFATYIKTEVERWAPIVRNSGAELE